jgi:hypothetical protein
MHEAPEFAPVTLPAKRFSAAWKAVFNAAGDDKDDFLTYRAVAVEIFDRDSDPQGVRLVCCNRSLMVRCWVPVLAEVDEDGDVFYDEPAPDVAPSVTVVVRDLGKRASSMLSNLLTAKPVDKDDDDAADVWPLTLTPGRITPDVPNLGSLFDEWGVVFTSPREQHCLQALEEMDNFPQQWRHLDVLFAAGRVSTVRFSASDLAAVARVPSSTGVQFDYEQNRTVGFPIARLSWYTQETGLVHGVLAPVRHVGDPTPDVDVDPVERFTPDDAAQLAEDDTDTPPAAEGELLPRGNYEPPPFDSDDDGEDWFDQLDATTTQTADGVVTSIRKKGRSK